MKTKAYKEYKNGVCRKHYRLAFEKYPVILTTYNEESVDINFDSRNRFIEENKGK